ncbi:MAG: DUF5677 domain-containing protein [Ignavibacteriaceae bacterium]|nr:DUF5677 domain-containing protein [Ignavibacteriaceae bacterium]
MNQNISFSLPDNLLGKLCTLKDLNDAVKKDLILINEIRNASDIQHQVLFINLVRVLKYFDSYLLLVQKGYGEPAAALLRSIYEANIWMRWSLVKPENAQLYFDGSKGDALRMIEKLLSRNLAKLSNAPDPEIVREQLRNKLKEWRLPRWDDMAVECGMGDIHAYVYPFLSAMSHGSWLFIGERLLDDKSVSPLPDEKNIEPFIPIANNILRDCYLLCDKWIRNKKLHPLPDFRNLMTCLE